MAKHEGKSAPTIDRMLREAADALDQNNFRRTSQRLADAFALEPKEPRVWNVLGHLHLKAGNPFEAAKAFTESLKLDPDRQDAATGLVKANVAMGQGEIAEGLARSHLERFPDHLELGQIRAQLLAEQRRTSEAIAQLRDVVRAHPDSVESLNSLAKRLTEAGEFEESRNTYEIAIRLDRTNAFGYLGWVQAKSLTAEDYGMVRAMEAALSFSGLTDENRMLLLFALGKAFGDLHEFETSLNYYREANVIRGQEMAKHDPFREEQVRSYFELVRAIFTAEVIRTRQTDYDSAPHPIFIVGMFRSGTTLAEQILSNHSGVANGGEIPFWLEQTAGCFDLKGRTFDFARAKLLRKTYHDLLRRISLGKEFVTDKAPGNYRILGLLRILFPKARFIHCMRHPIDTCFSIYSTPFTRAPNYASDPQHLVFTYRQYRQTMQHWKAVMSPDDVFELRYEDLIERPEDVIRKMLSFCGLEFERACLSPDTNETSVRTASAWQVRQPIYKSSTGRWRRYEPWLDDFKDLLGLD